MIKRYYFVLLILFSLSFIFAQTCVPYTCQTYPGVCGNNLDDSCGGTINCACTECNDGKDNDNDGGTDSLIQEIFNYGNNNVSKNFGTYVDFFDDFSDDPFDHVTRGWGGVYNYPYYYDDNGYYRFLFNTFYSYPCYYEPINQTVQLNQRDWVGCSLYYDLHNFSSSLPWSVSFDFYLTSTGRGCADGIEIVAQNFDSDHNFVRNIAAELDVYNNGASYGDISNHHMSIMNGSRFFEYQDAVHMDPTNQDIHCSDFQNNPYQFKNMELRYDGNGGFKQYLDGVLVSSANFTVNFDYSKIIIPAYTGRETFRIWIDNLRIKGYSTQNFSTPSSLPVIKKTNCSDGIDNDNDNKTDYCGSSNSTTCDGGCYSLNDTSELRHDDLCIFPTDPYEWIRTFCNNSIDDDNDTLVDRDDPGCWTDPTDPTTYDPSINNETNITINVIKNYWAKFNSNIPLDIGTDVQVGDLVRIVSTASPPYSIYKNNDTDDSVNDTVESKFWVAEYDSGIDVGFLSDEGKSSNLIDIVNSFDDSPMNIDVISPKCGTILNVNETYEIRINASDEDDLINGTITIGNEFFENFDNLNGPIYSKNYSFDKSGNIQIVVDSENTRDEKFRNIINIIVINNSSISEDYYVASCIDEPKNFDRFQSSRIKFNASSSKGVKFDPTTKTVLTLDHSLLNFEWKFYYDGQLIDTCSGAGDQFCGNNPSQDGMTVVNFQRGFETVNDNYVTLSVSII